MNNLPMLDPKKLLRTALRRRQIWWQFYLLFLRRHDPAQAEQAIKEFRFWTEEVRVYGRLVKSLD